MLIQLLLVGALIGYGWYKKLSFLKCRNFFFCWNKHYNDNSRSLLACFAAVLCAERGIKSHLLLRGEQPEILTGYNLISTIYGNVTYVPRSIYANREDMLKSHAKLVAGNNGSVLWFSDIIESTSRELAQVNTSISDVNHLRKILVINEGAGDSVALLGNNNVQSQKSTTSACRFACFENHFLSQSQNLDRISINLTSGYWYHYLESIFCFFRLY